MDFFAPNYSFAALCLVAVLCFIFGRWSKQDGPARPKQTIGGVRSRATSADARQKRDGTLSIEAQREVEHLLGRGKLIAAVKVVRRDLGLGLKDAKDFIDDIRRNT